MMQTGTSDLKILKKKKKQNRMHYPSLVQKTCMLKSAKYAPMVM